MTATGGARILLAAAQVGLGDIPYVGPDGINDGSGATKDSFLNLAGDSGQELVQHAGRHRHVPGQGGVRRGLQGRVRDAATGYAGSGYACAQVVLDAHQPRRRDRTRAAWPALREAVRVAGTGHDATYKTILGDLTFDANGDTSQRIVSIYSFDQAGADGKGDWKFETQVDYAK